MISGGLFHTILISFKVTSAQKRETLVRMSLNGIRRRPTLPGRFQPSTISVLRLNFCVRDGNRWIPQAIVTGNQTEFGFFAAAFLVPSDRPTNGLLTSFTRRFNRSRTRAWFPAPSKPHRLLSFALPDQGSAQLRSHSLTNFSLVSVFVLSSQVRSRSPNPYSLFPNPFSSKIKPSTD